MKVSIDGLAAAIEKELNTYDGQVAVATKQAVEKVAESCRKEISQNAPERTGNYAKSWKKKLAYYSAKENRYTIYSTKYQLTHLLEYGHSKWVYGYYMGGRVSAKPHIRPAEENAEKDLIAEIKRKLS